MSDTIREYALHAVIANPESGTECQSAQAHDAKILARPPSERKDPGPPPDGGLRAWLQVLMGHLVIINTW